MDDGARTQAAALPQAAWQPATQTRWRDGTEVTEQHTGIRHTPEDSDFTFPLAAARWKKDDEMFWRYAFVAHDERRTDAAAIMARHRLKGGKEQLFKEVLRGLDLHHPPCVSLTANRMFYAIAALAYNLMKAVQLLCLPDDCQGWTVPTLLKQMVRLPATLVRHAPSWWLASRWRPVGWTGGGYGKPAGAATQPAAG